MFCAVYRVRYKGYKLARPTQPVLGVLKVEPFRDGSNDRVPVLRAELVSEKGHALLPILYHARIGRVRGVWMSVAGTEIIARGTGLKSAVDRYKQTWWCLVDSTLPNVATLPGGQTAITEDPMGAEVDEACWGPQGGPR